MLREVSDDGGHHLLEPAGDAEVQGSGTYVTRVPERVCDATGDEHEGAAGGGCPFVVDQEVQCALDDVEDVVLVMRVCTRTLRVGLQPPLRHVVPALRGGAVGLEHRLHPAHLVVAADTRPEDDRLARSSGVATHVGTVGRRAIVVVPGSGTRSWAGMARSCADACPLAAVTRS